MISIGIRACPSEVYVVVVEGSSTEPQLIYKTKLKSPASREFAGALSWYREQILTLCEEYDVEAIGIKAIEPVARKQGGPRAHIEGVIMEAGASRGLTVGHKAFSSIAAGINAKKPKAYVGKSEFRTVEGWETLHDNFREAVLAAASMLEED